MASDGRFIHKSLANGLETPANATPQRPLPASIHRRHAVYNRMLEMLTLEDREKESLFSRGLSEKQIAQLNYRTTDDVAERLSGEGFILDRVPGFFREQSNWKANIRPGFLIPVRDIQGRIRALQMRTYSETTKYKWFSSYLKILPDGKKELMDSGASSGCPVHWVPGKGRVAYIVEGMLKSDLVGMLTGLPILGKAGTDAAMQEIANASLNFDSLVFAYDMDWQTNKFVRNAMQRQYDAIQARSGCTVSVATWDAEIGKGLDDFLLAGATKIVVSPWKEIMK